MELAFQYIHIRNKRIACLPISVWKKNANKCTTYWEIQQPYWLLSGIVKHIGSDVSSDNHLFNPGKTLQQGQSTSWVPAILFYCDVGNKEFSSWGQLQGILSEVATAKPDEPLRPHSFSFQDIYTDLLRT